MHQLYVIVGSLIPLEIQNMCSVAEGDKDKRPKCGLLKLNGSKLKCHQEDCNEGYPAVCLSKFIKTSK